MSQPMQAIGAIIGDALVATARRAAYAAAKSVIEDAQGVAGQAVRTLRAVVSHTQETPPQPPKRVYYTSRLIK